MNFNKYEDFDKHIENSIPGYGVLKSTFKLIAEDFMYGSAEECGLMMDLGCTTGSFLSCLKKVRGGVYAGVDIADHSARISCMDGKYKFFKQDIVKFLRINRRATVISSLFTLQFVGAGKRTEALKHIRRLVEDGAVFLCAAKVHLDDSRISSVIKRTHIQYKRLAFTDEEILDKEMDMQGSMQYQTYSDFMDDMERIGNVSVVWASLGFVGVVVKK